jgi:hypothetical protein
MKFDAKQANAWRRDKIDGLIKAHKSGAFEGIETAMMAVRLPGSATNPAGIGYSLNDLRYHVARLIDRADYLETVRLRKESALQRVKGAVERREEKAERLGVKARRTGGTIPREEFQKVRDVAKAAQAEAEVVRNKVAGITAAVADIGGTIDALHGAARSIKALIDVRTTPVMQSERSQGVLVAEATAQ